MDLNNAFNDQERQIISGYLSLMAEKPYDKITVKELTTRCSIARTAFYRSFEDTYDLLERIEQYLLGEFTLYRPRMASSPSRDSAKKDEEAALAGKAYQGIETWFATGIRLRFILRAIMGENGDLYFKERLIKRLKIELNQMMDDERTPRDGLRSYYVAAISASYIGLLNHIALVEDADLLPVSEITGIANSMRVAYFRSAKNAPTITDAQLFGTAE
ncbi:MAG: TetR/AcrR family transcriptional regulator [Eggerthellaceae bacterium]|nr:TetR/AcrR family transcriptional regulator [Eggerthellaceae bacterium]